MNVFNDPFLKYHGTGRSCRMMQAALALAKDGKIAIIVVVDRRHVQQLMRLVLLDEPTLSINSQRHEIQCGAGRVLFVRFDDRQFLYDAGVLQGIRSAATFWDHYTIEYRYGRELARWLQFAE